MQFLPSSLFKLILGNRGVLLIWNGALATLGTLIFVAVMGDHAFGIVTVADSNSEENIAKTSTDDQNFQGLPLRVSTAQIQGVPDNNNITSLFPAGTEVGSISVTIPAAGNIVILTSGKIPA